MVEPTEIVVKKRQLALDTDKVTAIVFAWVFLVVVLGFGISAWKLFFGKLRLVTYQPLTLASLKSFNNLIALLVPFWMVWVAFKVWDALNRFQKLIGVLWMLEMFMRLIFANVTVGHTVRYSASMVVTVLGVFSTALLAVSIACWFSSRIRYV